MVSMRLCKGESKHMSKLFLAQSGDMPAPLKSVSLRRGAFCITPLQAYSVPLIMKLQVYLLHGVQ